MSSHWIDRAPAYLRGHTGPDGEELATPIDRRWLWRIDDFLAVNATTDRQRQLGRDLRQYLAESCIHHFPRVSPAQDGIPSHRQCVWCHWVDWVE
jgi:hypothetical protein